MAERPTKMLLDTGSTVTLIRHSCDEHYQLEEAQRPIVVANGDRLDTLGQVVLLLRIGGIVEPFSVLVACQLTQALEQIFSHSLGVTLIWG